MKRIISLLLLFSILLNATSLSIIKPNSVKAAENTSADKTSKEVIKTNQTTPLQNEITSSNQEVQPMLLPVWAAWALAAIAGAVISEIVSDIYSEVRDYVFSNPFTQSANSNKTGSIYDINMYGDKFNATLAENYCGDGYANNKTRVSTLQRALNARGYNVGTIDGIWGSKTKAGVKNFQSSKGLTADGIVGRQTWYYLQNK